MRAVEITLGAGRADVVLALRLDVGRLRQREAAGDEPNADAKDTDAEAAIHQAFGEGRALAVARVDVVVAGACSC